MPDVWFWQRIVTPHMAHLAAALVGKGCRVTYVAEESMSADRQQQGWQTPALPGVNLLFASDASTIEMLVRDATTESVHVCQGIRANGKVSIAQRKLAERGLRQWVIMETVDDSGWQGWLKQLLYRRLFRSRRDSVEGILAIGQHTADWVVKRGVAADKVYPFTYFLLDRDSSHSGDGPKSRVFRFVFAGQLIRRKRVDLLIDALAKLAHQKFELLIAGVGPEERSLRNLAEAGLADRVRWLGRLALTDVPPLLAQADCLVLPSRHDGWGAVVSEALMAGTPAVCSDACGAAEVVHASGVGGVFPSGEIDALATILDAQLKTGIIDPSRRTQLASWASALGADAGATYLLEILSFKANGGERPLPPWHTSDCRPPDHRQSMLTSSSRTACA